MQRELRDRAGRQRAHLRPDLRRREAPPPQARRLPRSRQARRHQRSGLRRLRRLRREIELRLGAAAGDRMGPQAHHRPVELQQGLFLRQRLLPVLRHRARRQAQEGRERRRAGATGRRCRRRACRSTNHPYGIIVTGIGGTGIVTIGAIIGMAAHLEGKGVGVIDMAGPRAEGRRGVQPHPHRQYARRHPRHPRRRRRRRSGARRRHRGGRHQEGAGARSSRATRTWS